MTRNDGAVPNQPKTPLRTVRVSDDLWHSAQEIAKERGESVSEIVRESLARYVAEHGKDSPSEE